MRRVCGPIAALLLGLTPSLGAAAALAPHQAAYRLSLAAEPAGGPLVQVNGGLVIEWRRACDGWISRQRLGFVAATEEGQSFTHDVRFSSWESLDGSSLRYSVRSFEGDTIEEEFRGSASRNGESARATFKTPEERQVTLPPGTVFPTDHLERVLEGAAGGERFVSHAVFDGWGFDALTQIATVIGQPRTIDPPGNGGMAGSRRAWPVSMAYYKAEGPGGVPEFETTFLLDEDGVLRDLVLDYGEFSLEADLVELDLVESPDC